MKGYNLFTKNMMLSKSKHASIFKQTKVAKVTNTFL